MCKVTVDNEEFKTIEEAAKFLEVTPSYLSANLGANEKINVNGFDVQRIGRRRTFNKIICMETKQVYNTITDLSNSLGVSIWKISNELGAHDVFKHAGKSYFRLSDKSQLNRIRTSSNRALGNRHITVMCKQTGEVFESIKELANNLSINPAQISNALIKEGKFRRNGLTYVKYQTVIQKVEEATQPIQLQVQMNTTPIELPKENAVTVIKNLVKQNIDSDQYYVAKVLIDVLDKLVNEKNIVNNS